MSLGSPESLDNDSAEENEESGEDEGQQGHHLPPESKGSWLAAHLWPRSEAPNQKPFTKKHNPGQAVAGVGEGRLILEEGFRLRLIRSAEGDEYFKSYTGKDLLPLRYLLVVRVCGMISV